MANIGGGSGNDLLIGTNDADVIDGFDGNDTIVGGLGADTLNGGNGDDLFRFNAVMSTNQVLPIGSIDGGSGYDTLDLRSVSPITLGTIALTNGGYSLGVYIGSQKFSISNVEEILLSSGSGIAGLPNNVGDRITIRVDSAFGQIFVQGNYAVYTGSGNDTFFVSGEYFNSTSGVIDGGPGTDTLATNINFTVDLQAGTAIAGSAFYAIYSIENVTATTYGYVSTVRGDQNNNVFGVSSLNDDGRAGVLLDGRGGDDILSGSAGADTLIGGDGNDNIYAGLGADSILGGDGNDHLYGASASGTAGDGADTILAGAGSDYIQGNAGDDSLLGGAGSDRIYGGQGNDIIFGEDGNDTVNGNLGNDVIDGGAGDDMLRGGQGSDRIDGSTGNDQLFGDLGDDTLYGGPGLDILTGGSGADLFAFGSVDAAFGSDALASFYDTIADYQPGIDHVRLAFAVGAGDYLAGSDSSLSTVAAARAYAQALLDAHPGTSDVAGIKVAGDTYLFFNGAGTSMAIDSVIRVIGVTATQITGSDFI